MYIDDDLDIARRKHKLKKQEDEGNKISINLRPKNGGEEEDLYESESKETMGIYSEEQSNNRKIIEDAIKSQNLVQVNLKRQKASPDPQKAQPKQGGTTKEKSNTIQKASNAEEKILNGPKKRNLQITKFDTQKKIDLSQWMEKDDSDTQASSDSESTNSTDVELEPTDSDGNTTFIEDVENLAIGLVDSAVNATKNLIVNETEAAEKLDQEMKLKNKTEKIEKSIHDVTIQEDTKILNKINGHTATAKLPLYSPELKARVEDEKHVGGDSIDSMGKQTESIEEQNKDEDESAKQMGVVIYTFSDKVTPGLLDYSVITFYVSVVFVAGKLLRGYLWGDSARIYLNSLPYPDELLTICEGVVISRMQKDIYREEELYLVLIDLIRSPEVLKIVTHPYLEPKQKKE